MKRFALSLMLTIAAGTASASKVAHTHACMALPLG